MPKRNRAREAARAQASPTAVPPTSGHAVPETPPRGVGHVITEDAARELARRLLSPGRAWPVVVVTTPAGAGAPHVDTSALGHEVVGLAEVVVLPTGGPSWAFSDTMPPRTQVYGGASRVYGVEHDWVEHPHRSRLLFAWSGDDDVRVRRKLVEDALAAAVRAGLVGRSESPTAAHGAGTVGGVVGGRAIVTLDDGAQTTIADELTLPGVPLARVVVPGQRVEGSLDHVAARLDIRGSLPDAAASRVLVQATYQPGDVLLARVRSVERDAVVVDLLPELHCRVPRERVTGNALDDLVDLFSEGEVVLGRAVAVPGGISVRLDDVDESEDRVVPAPALLPGGPPWLTPPEPPAAAPTTPLVAPAPPALVPESGPPAPAPPAPVPPAPTSPRLPSPALLAAKIRGEVTALPGPTRDDSPARDDPPVPRSTALSDTQLALATARAEAESARTTARDAARRATDLAVEVDQLRALVQEQREQVDRRDRQIAAQKTRYRSADLKRQKAARAEGVGPGRGRDPAEAPEFADPVDQLRHDVYVTWVRVVPAAEKAALPLGRDGLGDYVVGPRFCDSLGLEGVSRTKVLEAIVHVVTGRAAAIPGLQLHRLRSGPGGNDSQAVRDDGATCWRVSLQVNSPSARRLHFWRLPGGGVELSRVVLHDVMEP
ncbi:hypothetical protein IF650_02680 [Cellulosimicrobium terreum]|nr:hypothetical protein [Cellulosimicrobium terreum]